MSCTWVTWAGTAPGVLAPASITYSGRTPRVKVSVPSGKRRAVSIVWPATCSPAPLRRAGRKFIPGEPMKLPTKGVLRPARTSQTRCRSEPRAAARHHHHLVGEGQCFDLVVRHIDQRELELVVDLLELAAQLPLEVRVDHRQRFIEQHRAHVFAHQAAAEADLLLGISRQAGGARMPNWPLISSISAIWPHPLLDALGRDAAVFQREGQVLRHRHGVVDDRELEHLRNVALLWCQRG